MGGSGGSSPGGFGGYPTGGNQGGGSTGTGGIVGDGGSGWGGDIGSWGGSTGYGGSGTGGTPGYGGSPIPDGGTCSAPTQGPFSTADAPRPFGWTFTGTPAAATAGDAGTSDGGAGPAVCQTVPAAYPGTSCVGLASLRSTASGPAVVFGGGTQLTWDGTLPSALMPYVQQAGTTGDSVWVDYEKRTVVVCPFCGAYTTYTLEIRNSHGGPIRFYDQAGNVLPNLTNSQVMDIFGVSAAAIQTCTFPAYAGCNMLLRSEFDHQLQTTPPQTVVDATLTKVTTPSGSFQVIWASSIESYVQTIEGCGDGPGVASDTGFVATLLGP
jgi:hypothetical protein